MKTQLLSVVEGKQTGETIFFTMIECYKCGVPFMMPERLRKNFVDSQDEFFCPNGHGQYYTKSTEQIWKEKLERSERESRAIQQQLENKLLDEMNARKRSDKQLKRLHRGVCPCCNRSFVNLQQHMKKQHPEVVASTAKV